VAKMINRKSKSKPRSSGGDGILSHVGFCIAISLVGLLVAFALIWWQVVVQPHQGDVEVRRLQLLEQYTQLFDSRIAELKSQVSSMANASETISALASQDLSQQQQMANTLRSIHPHIARVELIEKGKGVVDLNAEVPISFAALDLIRRAETQEFVGPQVSLNQRRYTYAAQPITPDGTVAGVLLVIFDQTFFQQPLVHYDTKVGNLQVMQRFDGAPTTAVMQWGTSDTSGKPVQAQLVTPDWTLQFTPSSAMLEDKELSSKLLVPFLVSILVIAAAIYLSFARYAQKLHRDAEQLTDYASRLMRGRSPVLEPYRLGPIQQVAIALSAYGKNRQSEAPPAETPSENSNDGNDSEDGLLQDLDDETAIPKKKTNLSSDAFLEVAPSSGAHDNFGIEVSEDVGPIDMGLKLDPGIFRAYDIRGITTSNLTEDVVYWIGRAFASQAISEGNKRIAIGWDGRHSSVPLSKSLAKGLTESGADVITIGLVPTPLLYYATYALDTGTGIMITGSHNPPEYNGLKMMIGGVTLAEDRIQAIYQRIVDNDIVDGEGEIEEIDLDDNYVNKILTDVAVAQPLKVVVDCGNGVAGKIAPRLLTELGCEVIPLYCEVDGDFPNHHPDPAEPKNLEDLITVVKEEKADLGLAFDGDGDRLGVVTNTGEIIWPDKLIMLFAQDIVGRNPGADIIYDVKCSRHLNSIISELGGRPIMWKTGHSHIKAKIRETGALLGGEFSGHICFAERWYGFDDALYSAARLLEIIGSGSASVDEIFKQFPVTFTTPEIKIATTESEKFEIMKRLEIEAEFGDGTLTTIDGIRVDYADSWGLIRPSNTSPVLTLRFEADGPAALDRIQDLFQQQLDKVDPNLKFR